MIYRRFPRGPRAAVPDSCEGVPNVTDSRGQVRPPDGPGADDPAAAPGATSRAGRDLPAAIGVGVGLGALVICALLFWPPGWVVLVAIAVAAATGEVAGQLRRAGYDVPVISLLLGGQLMIWLTLPYGMGGIGAGFAATALVTLVWRLFSAGLSNAPQNYIRDSGAALLVAAWIPTFGAIGALMVQEDHGGAPAAVFVLMIGVVCSDVGGYAAGVLFGAHPMVPAISPKKSWEGLAGSLVTGMIGGALTVWLIAGEAWWIGVLLGALIVVVGTLGDLIESQFKRDLGIKDMSTLLPGHGGMMDRIDSALAATLPVWLILVFWV